MHGARPGKPEDRIGNADAPASEPPAQQPREGFRQIGRRRCGVRLRQRQNAPGFDRKPQALHSVLLPDAQNGFGNRRMQVEMLMRVDVIERETGRAIRFELRFDLVFHLTPHVAAEKNRGARARHVVPEIPVRIDQVGDCFGGQDRSAVDEHDVKPDMQ